MKYLLLTILVIISFAVGFGLLEHLRVKKRPQMSAMAELAGVCAYEDKDVSGALESLYVRFSLTRQMGVLIWALGTCFMIKDYMIYRSTNSRNICKTQRVEL